MNQPSSHDSISNETAHTVLGAVYGLCFIVTVGCALYVFRFNHNTGCLSDEAAARKTGMTVEEFRNIPSGYVEMQYPRGLEFLSKKPQRRHIPMKEVDTEKVRETIENILKESDKNRKQVAVRRRCPPLLEIYERKHRHWLEDRTFRKNSVVTQDDMVLEPPTLQSERVSRPISSKPEPQSYQSGKIIMEAPKSHKGSETPVPGVSSQITYDREQGLNILRLFNQKAQNRLQEISREIQDYSCILYKWDQTNILSREMDVMRLLIRENPLSIYAKFEYPKKYEGREWIYWDGHYDGCVLVNSGPKMFNRTLLLGLDSPAIRNSSTHSIKEMGFQQLLQQLIDVSSDPENLKNADVRYYHNAKVGDRPCYALEVSFEEKVPDLTFYRIEIFIDKEFELPVRLVMYDWPKAYEKELSVLEEYTYVIQGINVGLEDQDFCHMNPGYGFKKFVARLSEQEVTFQQSVMGQ